MNRKALALIAALLLFGTEALAQTVLQRSRLGHRVEDIDRIGNDVVTLDGYEIYSIPSGNKRIQKILDLRNVIPTFSNGMAWIAPEELFAIVSGAEPTLMRLVALDGTARPSRTIQYLGGYMPTAVEGLAFIPRNSPVFPGHLILATMTATEARLQVMTTAGQVVKQIIPAEPVRSGGVAAVTHYAGNRIVVTSSGAAFNRIWILDFEGNIVGGPIDIAEADQVEGITELRDGRVAAVEYSRGRLFMMDASLARTPEADRLHPFAPGLTNLGSVTWNSDLERHVVGSLSATSRRQFHAVPSTLDWAELVTYPRAGGPVPGGFSRARGSAYMPDEKRLAIAHQRFPQAILFYDVNGALAEQVDISAAGSPSAIAYMPSSHEFALRVSETNTTTLRIVNRQGAFVRDLDLAGIGVAAVNAVTYFEQSGSGRFLVAGSGKVWVVDSGTGTLLQSFNHLEKLTVRDVTGLSAITTGPDAGAFAVVDGTNNELVVFGLE